MGSRASKTCHLRIQVRQICTPPCSLVRLCPQLGSADEKKQNYYLGPAGVNSVCQDPCIDCFKPLPSSPSQSDSQWLSPADSPAVSVVQNQRSGSHKETLNAEGSWLSSLGSLFPVEDLSMWPSTVLPLGYRHSAHCVASLLTRLMQFVLLSEVQGEASASSSCSRMSCSF